MDSFAQEFLNVPEYTVEDLYGAGGEQSESVSHPFPATTGTPREGRQDTISMSTAFHPDANFDPNPTDHILISVDKVFFHVHSHVLQNSTSNFFNSVFLSPPIMWRGLGPSYMLDDRADVLNVLLHTAYHRSVAPYSPTVETIVLTLDALHKYGMPFDHFLAPATPLFTYIVSQAALSPIDVYMAAARYRLEDLAVPVSTYLLSFPLSGITDEMADRMGAVYLKRLIMLQISRTDELRKLLLTPPSTHPDTLQCGFVEQRTLTREWTLSTSELSWQIRPDFSANLLQATLESLNNRLTCEQCKKNLSARVRQIVLEWTLSKRTI